MGTAVVGTRERKLGVAEVLGDVGIWNGPGKDFGAGDRDGVGVEDELDLGFDVSHFG